MTDKKVGYSKIVRKNAHKGCGTARQSKVKEAQS